MRNWRERCHQFVIRQKALMDGRNGPAKMRDGLDTVLKGEGIHKNEVTEDHVTSGMVIPKPGVLLDMLSQPFDLGYSQEIVRSTTTAPWNKGRCIDTTTESQLLNFAWTS